MKAGGMKKILAAFAAFIMIILIGFTALAAPVLTVSADELTAFDKTAIEDDLANIDLSAYPKNESGDVQLMNEVGFVEYAFSYDTFISEEYYGVYFYVYNPTEAVISTRAGANVVNMAISYGSDGNPSEYANLSLTLLDCTENHRFYKFRLTNGSDAYKRAKSYALSHTGKRRYDIAGIQLWVAGAKNATDYGVGKTFTCTGFSQGCGGDPEAESTLETKGDFLETVELNVKHTFYRSLTSSLGIGHQNQLDTVYFSVPQRLFNTYGTLQRIKAEWWEYKTKEIVVTSNEAFYNAALPYVRKDCSTYKSDIGYSLALDFYRAANGVYAAGGWNIMNGINVVEREGVERGESTFNTMYYLFPTSNWCDIDDYDPYADIESSGGVSSSALEQYIFNYSKTYAGGTLECKEGSVSADLFEDDIDENRKADNEYGKIRKGYSYYDFDAVTDLQQLIAYDPSSSSWAQNVQMYGFWNALFKNYAIEDSETLLPIYILKESDLSGTVEEVADRLKINVSDVSILQQEYNDAVTVSGLGDEKKVVVLFRFAVSDYYSEHFDIIQEGSLSYKEISDQAYVAQESVFLNFDIIQLSFLKNDKLTVIPVVASPIDIINSITTPFNPGGTGLNISLILWLTGIMAACIVGIILTRIVKVLVKKTDLK